MSTPLSSSTPPHYPIGRPTSLSPPPQEEDLTQKMQRMIRLQYEQQRHVQHQQQQKLNQLHQQQQQQQPSPFPPPPPTSPLHRPADLMYQHQQEQQQTNMLPPFNLSPNASDFAFSDNFVGLGTLILKAPAEEMLLRRDNDRRETSSSTSLTVEDVPPPLELDEQTQQHHQQQRQQGMPTSAFRTATTPMFRSGGALQSLVTYGTLSTFRDAQEQLSQEDMLKLHNVNVNENNNNNNDTHRYPDRSSPHRTPSPTHQTEFLNVPYQATRPYNNDELVNILTRKIGDNINDDQYNNNNNNINNNMIHPGLRCLFALFQRCFHAIWTTESLHRAFCYGAIDGMLTGAGIVSAFCGFNLLDTDAANSPQIRILVVAFTAAACFSDSVCMAVSHIWTTHVMITTQVAERAEARRQLQQSNAEAKGMLVDMLLSKGMLTLDAKSLADTLEGYPDMFVSVLMGESLWGTVTATPASNAAATERHQHHLPYDASTNDTAALLPNSISSTNAGVPFRSSWRGILSYGRLNDFEMDPDHLSIRNASREAIHESIFMMLGFSLLSVIPSLIFTWVPALLADSERSYGSLIQPNTLVIFLTACVMWCLGVWKSYFMDTNHWIMFGFETVMVLFLCIGCAYCLGALLNKLFLPDDYILEVAKPP